MTLHLAEAVAPHPGGAVDLVLAGVGPGASLVRADPPPTFSGGRAPVGPPELGIDAVRWGVEPPLAFGDEMTVDLPPGSVEDSDGQTNAGAAGFIVTNDTLPPGGGGGPGVAYTPQFPAISRRTKRRHILDAIERRLLAVRTEHDPPAAFTLAVAVGGDRYRVAGADGSGAAAAEHLSAAQAQQRGCALCDVTLGDEAPAEPERSGRRRWRLDLVVETELPPRSAWPAGAREEDIADLIDRDVQVALTGGTETDRQLGGLVNAIHVDGGGALYLDEHGGALLTARAFSCIYRTIIGEPWLGAPETPPATAPPVAAAALHYAGAAAEASVGVAQQRMTLWVDGAGTDIPLTGLTVAQALDAAASAGWTVSDEDPGLAARPAQDIAPFAAAGALGAGNKAELLIP